MNSLGGLSGRQRSDDRTLNSQHYDDRPKELRVIDVWFGIGSLTESPEDDQTLQSRSRVLTKRVNDALSRSPKQCGDLTMTDHDRRQIDDLTMPGCQCRKCGDSTMPGRYRRQIDDSTMLGRERQNSGNLTKPEFDRRQPAFLIGDLFYDRLRHESMA